MSKNKIYKGIIVLESLEDKSLVSKTQVLSTSKEENGTHYSVLISKTQIEYISKYIKEGSWYAYFWHGNEVLVVFRDHVFKLLHNNQASWRDAVGHGIAVGIPRNKLTFVID